MNKTSPVTFEDLKLKLSELDDFVQNYRNITSAENVKVVKEGFVHKMSAMFKLCGTKGFDNKDN